MWHWTQFGQELIEWKKLLNRFEWFVEIIIKFIINAIYSYEKFKKQKNCGTLLMKHMRNACNFFDYLIVECTPYSWIKNEMYIDMQIESDLFVHFNTNRLLIFTTLHATNWCRFLITWEYRTYGGRNMKIYIFFKVLCTQYLVQVTSNINSCKSILK